MTDTRHWRFSFFFAISTLVLVPATFSQVAAPDAPAPGSYPTFPSALTPVTPPSSNPEEGPAPDTMGRAAAASPAVAASPSAAKSKLGNYVHWVRDSAEYNALCFHTFKLAAQLVDENSKGLAAGTWCIVTDADETVLDNSQFQK